MIQLATDPAYWDAEDGGAMDYVESGYLLVTASPSMQRRVARVLSNMR